VFNGLRYVVRNGCQWRYLPNDLPQWNVVYQQAQRWIRVRCLETMVEDLRLLLREFGGRKAHQCAHDAFLQACAGVGNGRPLIGRGTLLLDAQVDLANLFESQVPAAFQLRCDQPVLRIGGVILSPGSVSRIAAASRSRSTASSTSSRCRARSSRASMEAST
jgi:Putative transposase of IS4/5 family (DUF4096)